ncbi:hypothetical protein ACFYW1_29415 [Streptomyces sp. NPDC002669]|uniref:hypothetical protein n=1 Tax=Streptomyces sp. NPDC002669 TaxID=3364658 RepID=UPI00368CC96A
MKYWNVEIAAVGQSVAAHPHEFSALPAEADGYRTFPSGRRLRHHVHDMGKPPSWFVRAGVLPPS